MVTPMNKSLLLLVLATFLALPLLAQAPEEGEEGEIFVPVYSLGDQTLQINLGAFIPLFFFGGEAGVTGPNLTLGGAGSIAWDSYLSSQFTVGGELGGSFAFTPNRRALWMARLAARGGYIFRFYPFEIPVTAALGVNISALETDRKIDPFLKLGPSFFWNYSSQWAFGANLHYWFVPQLYRDDPEVGRADASRFGNFLEFTLSALYHL